MLPLVAVAVVTGTGPAICVRPRPPPPPAGADALTLLSGPYPPEKQTKEQQNDHPNPAIAAFFCVVVGLTVGIGVRSRESLVHLVLLCPVTSVQFVSYIFSYWNSRASQPVGSKQRISRSPIDRFFGALCVGEDEPAKAKSRRSGGDCPRGRTPFDGRIGGVNSCRN